MQISLHIVTFARNLILPHPHPVMNSYTVLIPILQCHSIIASS